MGAQASLFTRGTESNHTAFFVDGRRLNPGFGNQYSLEFLNLGNLSSVQIQRGASSVHYGSSGIGGVVDMRTLSGLGASEWAGSFATEFGSNDYGQVQVNARYGSKTLGVTLDGSFMNTNNERANDDFANSSLSSRVDWQLTDRLRFEVVGMHTDSEKGLPNSVFNPKPKDQQDTEIWLLSPGLRFLSDTLSAHLFYSRSESQADLFSVNEASSPVFPFPSLGFFPIENTIKVDSDELNLQIDYSLSEQALFTFGGVYRNDEARNSNLTTFSPLDPATSYRQTFEQVGAYVQLVWLLGDFEFRAGLRHDDYSEFEDQTTGNLELVYQFEDLNAALFLKAATSYAPPGAAEIAFDTNQFFSDASTRLQPEESKSYEIGWRQSLFSDSLDYSIVFFRNDIEELIDFVFDPITFNSDAVNVEEAMTEGVEFQVSYKGIEDLELGLGYTYLTALADFQDNPETAFVFGMPDAAEDVRLARRPRHQLQLSARFQFTEALNAGIQGVGYFDRRDFNSDFILVEAEDYFVTRLVADWDMNESWSLFLRVENLLDESYAPAAGFPALGRAGYIGGRFTF